MNSEAANKSAIFNLELFFELSADLICIAGYDGYFKRINPTVSKTLGYTNEELFARPINDFVYIDDQQITSGYRNNLKNNNPLLNFENRYVTKSGEIVWLSWTSMPFDSEQVVFAIAKVVTHKRKLDDERNELLANLTKLNNDLKQLTYTTSHDLRSPVSNLLSIFNLLDVSKIKDTEVLEYIAMLKGATEELKNTLNNYVDALNQKEVLNVHSEEVDLQGCFNAVRLSISSLIQGSKASIRVDFSEAATVLFNKTYMESVFLNLITNSIKYAKPHLNPEISIYTKLENGVVKLIFTDNGLGFDMDKVKDRIFGFNQQFHNHADSKGIGLYLVYNHITSLGGQIAIESKVNEGAKFIITFKG
jgi:PAS domain S-box-containing protein